MANKRDERTKSETLDQIRVARCAMLFLKRGELSEPSRHMGMMCLTAAVRAKTMGLDELALSFYCGHVALDRELTGEMHESLYRPFAELLFDAWSFTEGCAAKGEIDLKTQIETAAELFDMASQRADENGTLSWTAERVEWLPEKTAAEFEKVREALVRLTERYDSNDMRKVQVWLTLSAAGSMFLGLDDRFAIFCFALGTKAGLALSEDFRDRIDVDGLVGLLRINCGLVAVKAMDLPPFNTDGPRNLLHSCRRGIGSNAS